MSRPGHDIHIVLTGTIVPNSASVVSDPLRRRKEYLDAIAFYLQFAPVHFLENSTYDLIGDPDFKPTERFFPVKMPPSMFASRGKGFQEFEMLDRWIEAGRLIPDRWIKITGRYTVRNIDRVLKDCASDCSDSFVIDLCPRKRIARTHLFYIETRVYSNRIAGCYSLCDDEKGHWIERVLYQEMVRAGDVKHRTFAVQPDVWAVSGATGGLMHSSPTRLLLTKALRRINRLFDKKYLWYAV